MPLHPLKQSPGLVILCFTLFHGACNTDADPVYSGEVAAAERLWDQEAVTHYRIESRDLCFCPPEYDWATLEVRNDTVLSVVFLNGDSADSEQLRRRVTVSQSFDRIRRLLDSRWSDIDLQFDRNTGFPAIARFDPGDDVIDGGAGFEMRNLQVLAP